MLEIEEIELRYGAVKAVRDVSLRVEQGELVTLLGANGAGKSSTLKSIAGVLKPARGTIRLDGRDISGLTPEQLVRRGVAMVPETRDVFPDLTVEENLQLGAFCRRRDTRGVAASQERMFELFPLLAERIRQPAGTLSGGQQQQLVIARAMMSDPRLLLLDEPSLGLAPVIVDRIFEMILELRQSGVTILLVEQNASKALKISDRSYVLSLGRVATSGASADIAAGSDLKSIYLG
ncbi:ABC transporter ATP-binding protein [Microbaculum marinisediminis]|uniref:ABC transporter ATP-binding protein n=1 Tax=Microbaculum marinisediminis TaxID=2931392 RepID=A0AAW5R5H3_9HYPH|nr:ABC transporter ATP-binding protein [Microbaculum sp. A6E488]MCT8974632.1 ABC transporter ATP-binding protein [Microbaculum sp. A6E488]